MRRTFLTFLVSLICISLPVIASADRGWQRCAEEGGYCETGGKAEVGYGAQGRYVYKTVSGGISCDNGAFGDPAPGVPKHCIFKAKHRGHNPGYGHRQPEPNWLHCANEGGYCDVQGTAEARYGADGRYAAKMVSHRFRCNNHAFGGDPAPGVPKACYLRY